MPGHRRTGQITSAPPCAGTGFQYWLPKRGGFTLEDFRQVGRVATLKRGQAERILDKIRAVVSEWRRYAENAGVDDEHIRRITPTLRLTLPRG
jgi:hypothetical protein